MPARITRIGCHIVAVRRFGAEERIYRLKFEEGERVFKWRAEGRKGMGCQRFLEGNTRLLGLF